MGDLVIGVVFGGAAGFALGRWAEKAQSRKQIRKMQAKSKKGSKDEKKSLKDFETARSSHHRHHQDRSHGYKPLPSMPLRHQYPGPPPRHYSHSSETTSVHSWHHPHNGYRPQYLAAGHRAVDPVPGQQTSAYSRWAHPAQQYQRSTGYPTHNASYSLDSYGSGRYH